MSTKKKTALLIWFVARPSTRYCRARRRRLVVFVHLAFSAVRGARGRRSGVLGRLDVDLSILDSVDQAPAIRRDASIEPNVDVGLSNITTEDQYSTGLFRSRISITHREEQHAFCGEKNE